jgi:hypothetical protein
MDVLRQIACSFTNSYFVVDYNQGQNNRAKSADHQISEAIALRNVAIAGHIILL